VSEPPGSTTPRLGPSGSERVDIVDADDRVVRTVSRAEMRAQRLRHRAVFIAVVSTDGRVLIHQRSFDKDLWPGRWDLAVGGVVASVMKTMTSASAIAARKVGVTDATPVEIGGGTYTDDDVALVGRCFRVTTDGPFTFADGEVIHAEWVALDDLDALIEERSFLPDSVALLLPLLR